MSNRIEFENGSIIESIDTTNEITRSKRGQEQLLNNLLRKLYNKTDEELGIEPMDKE